MLNKNTMNKENMDRIKQMRKKLESVVPKGQKLSDKEIAIIESAISNVKKFEEILEKAVEDGVITVDEKKDLEKSRLKIVDEAYDIAISSEKMPEEEFQMLKTITEIVAEMKEHLDDMK